MTVHNTGVRPDAITPERERGAAIGGGRIDWLRLRITGRIDMVLFGMFGRNVDGTLEVVLYEPQPELEGVPLAEAGTLYFQRSNLIAFGYESSWEAAGRVATAREKHERTEGSRG